MVSPGIFSNTNVMEKEFILDSRGDYDLMDYSTQDNIIKINPEDDDF